MSNNVTQLLVISDIHGDANALSYVLKKEKYDYVIFCGDGIGDIKNAEAENPSVPFNYVRGNCDILYHDAPAELTLQFGKALVFIAHGHMFGVRESEDYIASHAVSLVASLVLYGHTHYAVIHKKGELTVMNPGSLNYGNGGTYGTVKITDDGISCEIRRIYT